MRLRSDAFRAHALFNGEDEDLLKKINEKSFKCVSQLHVLEFRFCTFNYQRVEIKFKDI